MSPDSPETRIGRLEQTVAALKQKVDDIAEDVRVFYPLVAGQEVLREKLERMSQDLESSSVELAQVRRAIEENEKAREKGQNERLAETMSNRRLYIGMILSFAGALLLAISAVVAALVG